MADGALTPPRKSVELEDPGAHDLESSEGESDTFQDASEGGKSGSDRASPIPITRVERVDDQDSYGEVPGTEAYKMRERDAVPDEIEIIPDGRKGRSSSTLSSPPKSPIGPQGSPVPKTVVEKVDPSSPSHGDVPGTAAFHQRRADAVPDEIRVVDDRSSGPGRSGEPNIQPKVSIPTTVVTKVDFNPSHGDVPGTEANAMRTQDAQPDVIEKKGDVADVPTISSLSRSTDEDPGRRRPDLDNPSLFAADGGFGPMKVESNDIVEEEGGFGDDFDDFEAGAEADDGFGDFDESVEGPIQEAQKAPPAPDIPFDIPDFSAPLSPTDLHAYLSTLFPTARPLPSSTTYRPPSRESNPIFPTPRSLSLWHQLATPPPLQPPNWVRSRIRRLFLVSLGVPVDLDEILPKSKQGRLILPSVERVVNSEMGRLGKSESANTSTTSLDGDGSKTASGKKRSTGRGRSTKTGPAPPPALDLPYLKLSSSKYDDAELDGLSHPNLKSFVQELEDLTKQASQVLEYWLKRRDEAKGEKEAFEGVIENLVKHARKERQNTGGKKGKRR